MLFERLGLIFRQKTHKYVFILLKVLVQVGDFFFAILKALRSQQTEFFANPDIFHQYVVKLKFERSHKSSTRIPEQNTNHQWRRPAKRFGIFLYDYTKIIIKIFNLKILYEIAVKLLHPQSERPFRLMIFVLERNSSFLRVFVPKNCFHQDDRFGLKSMRQSGHSFQEFISLLRFCSFSNIHAEIRRDFRAKILDESLKFFLVQNH